MGFDNRPANGKSHAEPVALGRVERLENLNELVTCQTGAVIADRDFNCVGTIGFRPHYDFAFARRRAFHGVKRVD